MAQTDNNNNNNNNDKNNSNNSHSNSSSLSSSSSSSVQRKLSQEAAIFNTFALIVRNKFVLTPSSSSDPSNVSNNGDDSRNSKPSSSTTTTTAQDRINRLDELYSNPAYHAEKMMLQKMNNNGMIYGIACGIFTFGFLRSGPRLMQRYLNRRFAKNASNGSGNSGTTVGGYTFDRPGAQPSGDWNTNHAQLPKRPGIFLRTIKLGLDLTLSLFVAAYGSLVFVDRKKLMDDMSKIPLVEGRSLISDELCDDFIDVYRGIPKKTWDTYQGKSDALDAISGFVMNCMRRQVVEKEILEQRRRFGMTTMEDEDGDPDVVGQEQTRRHVEIPSPGVSSDIPVSIEWKKNKRQGTSTTTGGRSDGWKDDDSGTTRDYMDMDMDIHGDDYNDNDDDDFFFNVDDFSSPDDPENTTSSLDSNKDGKKGGK